MSSFMVEDKTINRIVSQIYLNRDLKEWLPGRIEKQFGFDKYTGQAGLGQAMFQLNAAAVNDRYGEGQAEEFRPLTYEYHTVLNSACDAYKALGCWLYQCSEGNVPQTDLFQYFETTVKGALADYIIGQLPEYERAAWS